MTVDKNTQIKNVSQIEFTDSGKALSLYNFKKQIQPIGNKVLVLKLSPTIPDYQVKNIIVVQSQSESTENRFTLGKVLAIGEKVVNCKIDDYIIYGKWAGIDINTNNEKYSILKDEEISSIVYFGN